MTARAVAYRAGSMAELRHTGPEHDRVLQVAARFIGAGFIAYLLVSIPQFGQPAGMVAPWFTPVAVLLAFGPGIGLFAVTFLRNYRRLIPVMVAAAAAGYVLAIALWFPAWTGMTTDIEATVWLNSFTGLPPIAVAFTFGLRSGAALLVLTSALGQLASDTGRIPAIQVGLLPATVFAVLFSSVFMVGMWMATRTGRELDDTLPGAKAAAAESAAVEARSAERARFDGLIHDRVIATLVAVEDDRGTERLAAQARAALDELSRLGGAGPVGDTEVTAAEAIAGIRATVAGIDPDTPVDVDRVDDRPLPPLPAHVLRALSEAVGEAMRNSVLHAGPDAGRAVLIELAADEIRVTVVDDGTGFDPAAVPPQRLGIEVSIRQRVAALPGGWARVHSAVGRGTTVQVAWERTG